jgi:WD40 repeat protein
MSSCCRGFFLLVCASLVAAAPPAPRTDRDGNRLPAGALVRLGATRLHQVRDVRLVAFSPDGKVLAISAWNHPVRLWDVASGKLLRRLDNGEYGFHGGTALTFSRDGKFLLGKSSGIWVWNLATGKRTQTIYGPDSTAVIAISPNGKVVAGGGGPILFWDIATGKEILRLDYPLRWVDQLVFSPDGKTLAALTRERPKSPDNSRAIDGAVALWDVATGKELANREKVRPGALFGDGKRYTQAGKDGRIQVCDLTRKDPLRKLQTRELNHVVSRDGKFLASIDNQQVVRVWDGGTGRLIKRIDGDRSPEAETREGYHLTYYPCAFSPDGKLLATGCIDDGNQAGGVRLWDVTRGKELLPAQDHFAAITCLAFAANGKTVVSGSRDRTVCLWDASTGRFLRRFTGHQGTIDAVALSGHGKVLASSSQDRTVRLWETATGRQLHRVQRPGGHVASLCFLEGGKVLQVCDLEGLVCRYDVVSGKLGQRFQDSKDGLGSLPFGPDGLSLVMGTEGIGGEALEKLLPRSFFQQRRGRLILKHRLKSLCHVRISGDGRMVATVELTVWGGFSGPRWRIRVWEIATGGLVADLGEKVGMVCSLVFSGDGWGLFTGQGDFWDLGTTIVAWDLPSRKYVHYFEGPASNVRALAVAPDGTRLATGTSNATVLVWDVSSLFRPKRQPRLEDAELKQHWARLGEQDAREAYLSAYRLASSPAHSGPFVGKQLRVLALGAGRSRRLISDLDDETFAVRDRAMKELERLGGLIEPALRRALKNKLSPEVRQRIVQLLGKLARPGPDRARLQVLRGISVLERIGTARARQALKELVRMAPDTLLGLEAEAALRCLAQKPRQP